jgi:3-hydroxybutyryl-CoA dehydrogenase
MTLCDRIGLDVLLAVMEVFRRAFKDPKYRPAPLLRRWSPRRLGRKSGRGFYV